jgi:mannose-P-dolichol utilization defect 1
MLKAGSAEGVSFLSEALAIIALIHTVAYNVANGFLFSTWGESLFLLVQGFIISTIILAFSKKYLHIVLFLTILIGYAAALLSGSVSIDILAMLHGLSIPITSSARLIQIISVIRNKSTGTRGDKSRASSKFFF